MIQMSIPLCFEINASENNDYNSENIMTVIVKNNSNIPNFENNNVIIDDLNHNVVQNGYVYFEKTEETNYDVSGNEEIKINYGDILLVILIKLI